MSGEQKVAEIEGGSANSWHGEGKNWNPNAGDDSCSCFCGKKKEGPKKTW